MTSPHPAAAPVVDLLGHRLRDPGYRAWRAQVQAIGGCAAPIHLTGSSQVLDRDGAVLLERAGTVLAPCGNRRAAVCPACSDRYAADAYHLLRAGLASQRRVGRQLIYAADFATMNALLGFLTENCCGRGVAACAPAPTSVSADTPSSNPRHKVATR